MQKQKKKIRGIFKMDGAEKFQNKHSEYIYNTMENEVVEAVKLMTAKDNDVCKCEKCMYDISALALNNLKPHYITTHTGELFARAGHSNVTDKTQIMMEVARAVELVKSKKAHN